LADKTSLIEAVDVQFDRLYRKHRADIRSYVRRTFGPGPPDPDDIVQDAFVRLISRNSTDDLLNARAHLLTIARNLAIDAYRRTVIGHTVTRSVGLLEQGRHDPDASNVLSSKEEVERLASIIDTLAPNVRSAFLMHRIDGLSFSEIARRMGVSPSGARFLVARGLAACVAALEE